MLLFVLVTSFSLILLFDLLSDKLLLLVLFDSLSLSLKLIKLELVKCFCILGNFDTVVAVEESSSLVLISWILDVFLSFIILLILLSDFFWGRLFWISILTLVVFGSDFSEGKLNFISSNFFWELRGVSFFLFARLERPLNKLIPLIFYFFFDISNVN